MKEPIGFLPPGVRDLMPTNYHEARREVRCSEAEYLVGIALGLSKMAGGTFRMSGRGQKEPPRTSRVRMVVEAMREGMMIGRDAFFEGQPVTWPEYPRGWEEEDECEPA